MVRSSSSSSFLSRTVALSGPLVVEQLSFLDSPLIGQSMSTNLMMMVLLYPHLNFLGHCHSDGSVLARQEEEYPFVRSSRNRQDASCISCGKLLRSQNASSVGGAFELLNSSDNVPASIGSWSSSWRSKLPEWTPRPLSLSTSFKLSSQSEALAVAEGCPVRYYSVWTMSSNGGMRTLTRLRRVKI